MADETQETMSGPGRFCRGCGAPLRPGRTFCTSCGRPVAPPAAAPGPPERASRPVAEPDRLPSGRHRSRGRPLAIGIGGLAAAGLAAGIILVTHPFSHPAVADSASSTSPSAHTRTSRSAASTSPAASSSSASSTSAPTSSSPATSSAPASSSAPALSPAQAARGLAALLASSASDRQQINNAYNNVLACGAGLAQDAQAFRSAAASHRRLLSQLAQLPGRTALSQAMLSDLSSAWRASAAADDDFARWAQDQVQNGCTVSDTSDPNFVAAKGPDNQATTSKTAFVGLWNPMATGYGLPNYQQNQI